VSGQDQGHRSKKACLRDAFKAFKGNCNLATWCTQRFIDMVGLARRRLKSSSHYVRCRTSTQVTADANYMLLNV